MTADRFSVETAEKIASLIVEGNRIIRITKNTDTIPFIPHHHVRTLHVGSGQGDFADACFDVRDGFQPLGRLRHFPAAGWDEHSRRGCRYVKCYLFHDYHSPFSLLKPSGSPGLMTFWTVTEQVAVLSPALAVMTAVPSCRAVTFPFWSTDATEGLLEVQVTV